jgi:hypothetical protein
VAKHNIYRDGHIYVMAERCSTCIFRAGNLMDLNRGRVREMVDTIHRIDGVIPCHQTLQGDNAVCRGQYDLHKTPTLKLAEHFGIIEFTDNKEDK